MSNHTVILQPDGTLDAEGRCPISGKKWKLSGLDADAYGRWKDGELIQFCFPKLKPAERELLISGVVDEEFDRLFEEH